MGSGGASLVVGAHGFIGSALADRLAQAGEDVVRTPRRRDAVSDGIAFLDLSESVDRWRPPKPIHTAYLCAAVTSIDQCRRAPRHSAVVNVAHTTRLAEALVAQGAFVVFLSTNQVFDGTVPRRKAEDAVCPVTEYGRQKAEAEKRLLALGDSVSVIRVTKVLGARTPLMDRWIGALRRGQTIRPFSDMVMAPVSDGHAVEIIHRVGRMRLPGILQVSAEHDVTYAEFAAEMARRIGAPLGLVEPCTSVEAGVELEAVLAHTSLDTSRLQARLAVAPQDPWGALAALLPFLGA